MDSRVESCGGALACDTEGKARTYRRHRPEESVLYRVVQEHLGGFLDAARGSASAPLPRYVCKTFEEYLRCGRLEHGFVRAYCAGCATSRLVGFSCKRRGVCPSCNARRMCDHAAHLVDAVLPDVPVRPWVLSFPFAWRVPLARDAALLRQVIRVFAREIERAVCGPRAGGARRRGGAVTYVQRFGGSLNLHVHLHVLVLDGYYEEDLATGVLRFVRTAPPGPAALHALLERVATRCVSAAERRARARTAAGEPAREDPEVPDAVDACQRLALERGRFARGASDAGARVHEAAFRLRAPGRWGASVEGFDLHAGVCVEAGRRDVLERLCRYVARPPFALERLRAGPDGLLHYACKAGRAGVVKVRVLEPAELLARLAALIPPPRYPDLRYHGVLAPNAPWRARVVPTRARPREPGCGAGPTGPCGGVRATDASPPEVTTEPSAPGRDDGATSRTTPGGRIPWAELLRRIHGVDALACPRCGTRMQPIAVVTDAATARAILTAVGPEGTGPPTPRRRLAHATS